MSDPVLIREVMADLNQRLGLAAPLVVHFDGACEPVNPGGVATCGWTIRCGDELLEAGCCEVCRGVNATNNVAEWSALGFALRWLLDHHTDVQPKVIELVGDSQLVVNQLNDSWRCNAPHLQKLRERCKAILEELHVTWTARWIPREQNEEADALSRRAYEEATGKIFPERARR